jgi:Tol biopolymer transport system component
MLLVAGLDLAVRLAFMRHLLLAVAALVALAVVPAANAASSTLAFTQGTASGVYTVASAGGTPASLTSGYVPTFSPNGKKLATINTAGGLQVGNANGTGAMKTIAQTAGGHPGPASWSPNGKQLAYANGGNVWVVKATGGQPQDIYNDNQVGSAASHPVWAANGKSVYFLQEVWAPYSVSYRVAKASVPMKGRPTTVATLLPSGGWSLTNYSLSISPNGQTLAVTLVQNEPATSSAPGATGAVVGYGIGFVPINGGATQVIPGYSAAAFAPSGSSAALCAQSDAGGLVTVSSTGQVSAPLLADLSPTACSWVP